MEKEQLIQAPIDQGAERTLDSPTEERGTISRLRARFARAVGTGPLGTVRRAVVALARDIRDDDVLGLAAELSYRWLLAIFPLAIVVAALSGFIAGGLGFEDPTGEILDAAGAALPADAASTIRPQLERILDGRDGALLSLGLLLTIYAASSGMKAIIKGLNRAYGVSETRPFWRQILVALALTVLLGTSAAVSFIVLVAGQTVAKDVAGAIGLEEAATWLIEFAPFPIAIVALSGAAAFLYWAAPARRLRLRWVLPGVLVFVPGWILVTVLFSVYVANFGSYSDTYGALGGVIVLLVWFYLTGVILLIGGEVNAVLERLFGAQGDESPVETRVEA